jgi:hypothetical protein
MVAVVASPDAERVVRRQMRGAFADAVGMAARLGNALLSAGADEIIAEVEERRR